MAYYRLFLSLSPLCPLSLYLSLSPSDLMDDEEYIVCDDAVSPILLHSFVLILLHLFFLNLLHAFSSYGWCFWLVSTISALYLF